LVFIACLRLAWTLHPPQSNPQHARCPHPRKRARSAPFLAAPLMLLFAGRRRKRGHRLPPLL
jgi:hypothetical protein